MNYTVIDADNMVLGRLSTNIAKRIMKGEKIAIVNAEKAVVTGAKENIMAKYTKRRELAPKGNPEKGPKYSRMPDRMVKITIRGMLPWKSSRGKEAYKNLRVYIGVPEEFSKDKAEKVEQAKNRAEKKYVLIGDIAKGLGAKW